MAATYKGLLTNNGKALIASATLNNKINYSHIAVGDGNGSVPNPLETRTALVNEKARIALNVVEINPNNTNQIICEAIIPSNLGGFYIRELGLYAGATMVVNASYPPTYKPLVDEGGAREIAIKLVINIQNAEVIALYLDDSLIYATRSWVDTNYIRRNEIVDNLTTDDAKKPVSAKQAKNLQDNKLDKTANAVSSSKLETARTVSFSGAATGSFNFDGSGNSSCVLALANSGVVASTYGAALKIPVLTVNAKGLITGVSEQNIPIVDNLTTDDSTKPISAKQAKVLNENKLNRTSSSGQNFNLERRDFDGIHTEYTWLNGPNNNIAGTLFFNYSNDWIGKIFFDITENRMFAQSFQSGVAATPWKAIAYIDDNVASSTKLKTPRNVFGQTFDGSSDIGGTVTASTGLVQADSFHYIDMGRSGLDRMNFYNYGAIFNFIDSDNGNVVARITQNGIDCNAASASKVINVGLSPAYEGVGANPPYGLTLASVYYNGYPTVFGNVLRLGGSGQGEILVGWPGDSGVLAPSFIRSKRDGGLGDWTPWREIVFVDSLPSHNVGSATKLSTPRKINNVDFDGTKDINLPLLGVGQTWTNVAASRAVRTTYTNSTGRPIQLFINANFDNGYITLNGNRIFVADAAAWGWLNLIIPNGNTYMIEGDGDQRVLAWWELR
ncbi:phage tail protein [Acinetobacter johnsonii]|uniref:phage tail protein n=1 Tax=Acinetobacter johnsonii TaxID=40214 RepID=UPI001028B24D|nr:phage tail protein [Acinetobacter johnsonii]RZN91881.1 hypothetical protein EXE24_05770 [Acinetobacter johnsonii]